MQITSETIKIALNIGNIQTNSWETLKKRQDETKRRNRSTAKSASAKSAPHAFAFDTFIALETLTPVRPLTT